MTNFIKYSLFSDGWNGKSRSGLRLGSTVWEGIDHMSRNFPKALNVMATKYCPYGWERCWVTLDVVTEVVTLTLSDGTTHTTQLKEISDGHPHLRRGAEMTKNTAMQIPIIGQEAVCPDGLGRVSAYADKFPFQWICVETYFNNRSCHWDPCNVQLVPIPAAPLALTKSAEEDSK